ncbi:hypothetical protein A3753_06735 [Sulfitobacter sp. HI0082]|uniref:YciE/YciF ferroxidase family protein n=1 Tax=unclassified Sulfitobacter TaxID=196795 RepID=UPI0007CF4A0D|nr:hypothetical protein A3753_06735 [Sulfitobacter sp. HI0082]
MLMNNFKEMYVAELQEARSLEAQLVKALPGMIDDVNEIDLKQVLEAHLTETQGHLERVEAILRRHEAASEEHKDHSMQRLVSEADKWAGMIEDRDQRDAGIIASAQRIEHYEMAVYGTLAAWAKQLGLGEDEKDLRAILTEEQAADHKLTVLAEKEINPLAT